MDKIRYQDIDFSKLDKLEFQGSTSIIFRKEKLCYKILNNLSKEKKKMLYMKILDMEGIKIDGVLFPIDLIIKDGNLEGYTLTYFANSTNALHKFLISYLDCKEFFLTFYKASKILEKIHKNKIICQDVSFTNILINNYGDVCFCDVIDSCNYKEHITEFTAILMYKYIYIYRKKELQRSYEFDKVSMLLSFFYLLYLKEIQKLSMREYNELATHLTTLKNARKYLNMLLDKDNNMSKIPYLHEIIDLNDDFIFDRSNKNYKIN